MPHTEDTETQSFLEHRGELALAGRAQRKRRARERGEKRFLCLTQRARRTQSFLEHRGELALDREGTEQEGREQRGEGEKEGFYASHRGHGDTERSPDGDAEDTEVAFGGRKGGGMKIIVDGRYPGRCPRLGLFCPYRAGDTVASFTQGVDFVDLSHARQSEQVPSALA